MSHPFSHSTTLPSVTQTMPSRLCESAPGATAADRVYAVRPLSATEVAAIKLKIGGSSPHEDPGFVTWVPGRKRR